MWLNGAELGTTEKNTSSGQDGIQIRVIGLIDKPNLCTKMLRNLSKKLTEKFPVTTLLQMLSQKCLDWKQAQ